MTTIRSILVANRGEIARRVFRTARELGIATVAVHSDADALAPFVAEADKAVHLPGNAPSDTYLRGDLIVEAARKAGADAIHPGYGFLSENADFAQQVVDAGLIWIGPRPETITAMGSKIESKKLMKAAGVPILEIDPDSATTDDLPLLVKASAGGGGRGMRIVESLDALAGEMDKASSEAVSAFGDGTVFIEPFLKTARHVEVQVLADTHGTVWILGDRDCSVQRRHQKVVEEAPAPNLSDEARTTLHDAARSAAKAVDYVGAGTVEFLVDGELGRERVYFLEMNTRLQVEHPVTEEVFGIDLVELQIGVAEGKALDDDEPDGPNGHAIEVRLYAEDPHADWAPQTGTLRAFAFEDSPNVRVDSAVETGSEVGIHYDAMIAKVVGYGVDRTAAIRTLDGALRTARIHGLVTNRDMLRAVLHDDEFAAGEMHTDLLNQRIEAWTQEAEVGDYVIAAAVAEAVTAARTSPVLSRVPTGFRNVPNFPRARRYEASDDAEPLEVAYTTGSNGVFQIEGISVVEVRPEAASKPPSINVTLERDGVRTRYDVAVSPGSVDVDGPDGSRSFVPVPTFVDPADAVAEGSLLAPMPASVVSVAVEKGEHVEKGATIVVLEAMKMQHTITAPYAGVVEELNVTPGQQLETGAVLALITGEDE